MFKTKAQKRRLAQLDELVDLVIKITDGIKEHRFETASDEEFMSLHGEYTSKLDILADEIIRMNPIKAWFYTDSMIFQLMKIKAYNHIIVIWTGDDFQKRLLVNLNQQ